MANPQKEHGHTAFAHDLLEAVLGSEMSKRQIKVFLYVGRMTYGWSKKTAPLDVKHLALTCRMTTNHVYQELREMLEANLLIRDGDEYGIQKDFERWFEYQIGTRYQNGSTKSVPNKYQIGTKPGTKSVPKTPPKPASDAVIEAPKESIKEKKENIPPLPPTGDEAFLKFREAYPKCKRNKEWANAEKTWKKHKLTDKDLPVLLHLLAEDSKDWVSPRGDFGPLPATWLNKCRWKDPDAQAFTPKIIPFEKAAEPDWLQRLMQGREDTTMEDAHWAVFKMGQVCRSFQIPAFPQREVEERVRSEGLAAAFKHYWGAAQALRRANANESTG